MPQYGRRAARDVIASNGAGGSNPPPWEVSGVLAQMATFEVDAEATLDALPDLLSRPAPPYARLLVLDYPGSPVGPYREALLLLSSRFAMLPRQYVAASVVTSQAAADANLANWGYQSDVGEIAIERGDADVASTISHPSGLTIRVNSMNAQETGPAVIRYDPIVVVADEDGTPGLRTISSEPRGVTQAWIAVGTTVEYSGGSRDNPWLTLRSRNPITCTIAVQDMLLPKPEPVSATPGMGGGLP
jgi:hypothetical protein